MPPTVPAEPSARTPREGRVDIVRGFAILVILANHLTQVAEFGGLREWLVPTPTRYGYSTAAELFVILSGYMVGLVYLRRAAPVRAIWRRAGQLWIYNLGLLALILPLAFVMHAAEADFWGLGPFVADAAGALLHFVTLGAAPRLLDVLQLYIVLMLAAPLAILIERRSNRALICASVVLYAVAQVLIAWRLATVPGATKDGLLDRLCWQMLFFVPMALGARQIHRDLFAWLAGRWGVLLMLVAIFVTGAVSHEMEAAGMFQRPDWLTGRYGLTPLRVGHAVAVLLLYASALTLAGSWTARQPLLAVAWVGRHSLDCFAVGVLMTYWLGTAWLRSGTGHVGYYAAVALGVGLTIGFARWRCVQSRPSNPPDGR